MTLNILIFFLSINLYKQLNETLQCLSSVCARSRFSLFLEICRATQFNKNFIYDDSWLFTYPLIVNSIDLHRAMLQLSVRMYAANKKNIQKQKLVSNKLKE